MSGGLEQALGPLLHVLGGAATGRPQRLWRSLQPHRDHTDIQAALKGAAESIELHGNDVTINGGLSTYGSCLATQDALEWELLVQASQNLPRVCCRSDFAKLSATLTHRINAEGAAGNYLLCGRGRHNALG